MKRIKSALLAMAGMAWLFSAQAPAQMKDLAPDVVVEKGLEPLMLMTLQAAGVAENELTLRIFPPQAAGRAFCLSGKAFMLLAAAPLPQEMEKRCHAGLRKTPTVAGEPWQGGAMPATPAQTAPQNGKPGSGNRNSGPASATQAGADASRQGPRIVQLELAREPLVVVQPEGAVPIEPDGRMLYLALAKWIPQEGRLVRNPFTAWSDLGSALPNDRILILLPENARTVVQDFLRRACERGVLPFWEVQRVAVGEEAFRRMVAEKCASVRDDAAVRFVKGDDAALLVELQRHRGALALMGHGTWLRNRDALRAAPPAEDMPSRPLFLVVDRENLKTQAQGVQVLEALARSVREAGLLPPPPEEREVLNILLAEAKKARSGQQQDRAGVEAERGGMTPQNMPGAGRAAVRKPRIINVMPGTAQEAQPPTGTSGPRATGGVQMAPAVPPGAERVLDLEDLPPATGQRP